MSEEPYALPACWAWSTIGEFASFIGSGITPFGGRNVYVSKGVPFVRSQNVYPDGLHLDDVVFVTPRMHAEMKRTHVKAGDVLLNITGASIGRSTYVPDDFGEANVNQHVCIIRADTCIPAYLSCFLNSPLGQEQIFAIEAGVTREGLNYGQIRRLKIPLAPLEEQRRIAQLVRELMARNQEARSRLQNVTPLIRQFRQSVLAKAFRGEISERDPNDEPAEKLLERIRQERRKKWEEELRAKGKDQRNYKHEELEPIDSESLRPLPSKWTWARMGETIESMKNGIYKLASVYGSGVPCLRMYNIEDGNIVWRDLKLMRLSETEIEEYGLRPGDVLLNRVNSRELVGKAAVVPEGHGKVVFESKNIRIKFDRDAVDPHYICYYLQTTEARRGIELGVKQTVGMATVNQTDIEYWPLPLAPKREQGKIVAKIREAFAQTELVTSVAVTSLQNVAALEQSILAKAFRGELCPQHPDDEPASVLLKRIRAQRATVTKRGEYRLEEFASPATITPKA